MLRYTPPADTPSWAGTQPSLGRCTPGQVHPLGRYTLLGRYTPRAGTPPNDGHCSGRYTSYWNAFLFYKDFKTFRLISMSLLSGFSYSNQGRFADRRYSRNVFQRRLTILSCQCSSISQIHGFNVNWQHRKRHALLRSENRVITTDTQKLGFLCHLLFSKDSVCWMNFSRNWMILRPKLLQQVDLIQLQSGFSFSF